jgi:predicted RNase H-like nuclease
VGVRYGRRHASCHTSNLRLYPAASSVSLAQELARDGFVHAPISREQSSQVLLEVYPHAAMVALFDLQTIIKYKKGSAARKRTGLRELRTRLIALSTATPALASNNALGRLLHSDIDRLTGAALKSYEDGLDAVFCAYLGYHFWYWRGERTEVFGDVRSGYILNPTLVSQQAPSLRL